MPSTSRPGKSSTSLPRLTNACCAGTFGGLICGLRPQARAPFCKPLIRSCRPLQQWLSIISRKCAPSQKHTRTPDIDFRSNLKQKSSRNNKFNKFKKACLLYLSWYRNNDIKNLHKLIIMTQSTWPFFALNTSLHKIKKNCYLNRYSMFKDGLPLPNTSQVSVLSHVTVFLRLLDKLVHMLTDLLHKLLHSSNFTTM